MVGNEIEKRAFKSRFVHVFEEEEGESEDDDDEGEMEVEDKEGERAPDMFVLDMMNEEERGQ